MKTNFVAAAGVLLLTLSVPQVVSKTKADKSGLKSVEYKAGQLWILNQGITVTVLAVEDVHGVGKVVHVGVDKIPWGTCGDIHLTRTLDHLAVTERVMQKSALVFSKDNAALPESSLEAYRKWMGQKKHEIVKVALPRAILDQSSTLPPICNFLPSQA